MSLLSWARERWGWNYYGYRSNRYNGPDSANWAGKPVTADGAMLLSAWFRGVKLYAEVTGAASLKFYERIGNNDRKQVRDHPIADIISVEPNVDQTTQEFWGSQAAALTIFGNSYAEKLFSGPRLVGLQPLPFDTHPFRDENGDLFYRFNYSGKPQTLPRDKVFHTKGFSLGGDLGISPLAAARQELSISLATEEATGSTFAHGMRASGYFTMPAGMKANKDSRDEFRKLFIDPMTGNNADVHIGLLEGGIDFKQINIPPKDAEMLLSRQFNIEEIARFLGMPPILLGHSANGQTMWGTGVESIINQWLVLGLDAFWSNIEKSINKRLLSPADRKVYFAEFDRDGLMRADSVARADFISKMIQSAQMTPNEGRRKANQPPQTGGDILLINATLIPLTDAGRLSSRLPKPDQTSPVPPPLDPLNPKPTPPSKGN